MLAMDDLDQFLRDIVQRDAAPALMHQQKEWLAQVLQRQFGYYGLQLGAVTNYRSAWQASPLGGHFVLSASAFNETDAVVDYEDLPFSNQSIDFITLSYVLELSPNPYAVLREVDRLLINDGRLVVMGFRPGNIRKAAWFGEHKNNIDRLSLLSASRVVDILQTLGYEIQRVDYFPSSGWQRWLPWFAPSFSEGYALLAHKKTARINLIGLRDGWRWQSLLPQLVRGQQKAYQRNDDSVIKQINSNK